MVRAPAWSASCSSWPARLRPPSFSWTKLTGVWWGARSRSYAPHARTVAAAENSAVVTWRPCVDPFSLVCSIGSSRVESSSGGGGDKEVQRTMLELLNQLDGFEPSQNIKVVMATNRIDILDPALLRPGRIDRKIEFPPPNEAVRTLRERPSAHQRAAHLLASHKRACVCAWMCSCSRAPRFCPSTRVR
ncbi:26S protease regulatory subunit [archaeon]|nr:MAG: 26S protease regulatory subunit [archaeon]